MNAQLLLAVGLVYVVVALRYISEGRLGMGLAFVAYALANVGFAWDAIKR
jgi:hypothetical protein